MSRRRVLILAVVIALLPVFPQVGYALQDDCPGAPPPRLTVGMQARVILQGEGPDGLLRVRESPGTGGNALADMRSGEAFSVVGGPQCVDGYRWWQVVTMGGVSGWSAEGTGSSFYFVEPTGEAAPNPLPVAPNRLVARLGVGQSTALAWSPDGQTLAVGGVRGVWFYNAALERLRLLEGSEVRKLAWRPDGAVLAVGDTNGIVTLWDVAAGAPTLIVPAHSSAVLGLDWSSDGARLATVADEPFLRLWDAGTGVEIAALPLDGNATSVDWSPDGAHIGVGYRIEGGELDQGRVQVWDAAALTPAGQPFSPQDIFYSGLNPNVQVLWNAGGDELVVSYPCGPFILWTPQTGEEDFQDSMWLDTWCVRAFDWKPDGSGLVWAIDSGWGTADILDQQHNPVYLDDAPVRAIARRPGSSEMALLGYRGLYILDGATLAILRSAEEFTTPSVGWDAAGQPTVLPPETPPNGLEAVPLDGMQLEIRQNGQARTVIDVEPMCSRAEYAGEDIRAYRFSPDGGRIAILCRRTSATVWDTSTGLLIAELEPPARIPDEAMQYVDMNSFLDGITWTADGSRLYTSVIVDTYASAFFWSVGLGFYVWDPVGGRILFSHVGPAGGTGASWNAAQTQVATLDGDVIWVWDAATWRAVVRWDVSGVYGWNHLYWSHDGRLLAGLGSENEAILWNAAQAGREQARLRGHTGQLSMLAWSPDDTRVATGSLDGTVRVWDAASGQLLLTLLDVGTMNRLAWSPGGDQLAGVGSDGTARVWNVQ